MATAAGRERPEDGFSGTPTAAMKSIDCYPAMLTTSAGIWLGDNPLRFSLPILFYQIIIIFVVSNLMHVVLARLRQPLVMSQIVAGMLLGPNFLGRNMWLPKELFPRQSFEQLETIAVFSMMIFLFVIGVKADLGMIPKAGKKAVFIAVLGTLLPYVSVYGMVTALKHELPPRFRNTPLLLVMSDKWCLTSYAVLSCFLSDLDLLTSKLGRLAMSATLIADFIHLFADACIGTYLLAAKQGDPMKGITGPVAFFGMVGFIMLIMRPLVLWLIRRTPEGALLSEASQVAVLLMALACGLMSAIIGFDFFAGPFFFGLVLPGGAPLGTTLVERVRLVTGLLMPVSMALAGLRMDLASVTEPAQWAWLEGFMVLCVVAKFVGVILPCAYCNMPHRESVSLALMMITKGIYEVGNALAWRQAQLVDDQLYTVIIISIFVFGGSTAPLVKYLYRPEDRYVAFKRRTLQHATPDDELRILACVHEQDNVNPVLALLEATGPSPDAPICVYLLHLIQLVGRADAVIHLHKIKNATTSSWATTQSESDRIANAFRLFEKQYPGGISVLPYVSISPYSTMHDDICCLALDKKTTLIIVPFHKRIGDDDSISSANDAIQAVNLNVLQYAPCSVGIFVDHGLSDGASLLHHVAVYFLGGADDREALAYGVRMVERAAASLTVVRFLPPKEWREDGWEERLDDKMLMQYRQEWVDEKRVMYREEEAKDGEGMVRVIHETSPKFSLLIVGRREGKESLLTAGMSMWSEYPELGVIGDMLASTDFGGEASTLVVQQQRRVTGEQSLDNLEPTPIYIGKRVVPRDEDDYY
ncbi:unnamed protein product [Musa hybrid cultivar]